MSHTVISIDINGAITIHPSKEIYAQAYAKAQKEGLSERYLLEVLDSLNNNELEIISDLEGLK